MTRWDPTAIDEADFLPEPFRTADQASVEAQRQTLRWYRGMILMLVVAAAVSAVIAPSSSGHGSAAPFVSVAAFLLAGYFWARLRRANPQARWYEARAAAESVKTLAWKYTVRAHPFDGPADSPEVDEWYREQVAGVLRTFEAGGSLPPDAAPEITDGMRQLRAADLTARRTMYLRLRVQGQRTWYLAKADACESQAVSWGLGTVALLIVGGAAAVAQALGAISVSIFGACSAAAAAVIAWTQLKQLRPLVSAYQLAARELDQVWGRLSTLDLNVPDAEAGWARLAGEVEDAVAREHTSWRARRAFPQ
ncbi:DUF4231 domain-containing protein [Kitasatospora sp. NBC_01287]|uniref:DUF4231 domain-containing protein n=1 Tax=Kitasatospora sp. NBC_01287 TaxID=2903573 RepID=UPI0022551B1B|nr:DUF4231 domain-containing protein [Kitasatospora sp. NBC_01287]MCX4747315.1 DUF4231 domain-containing protein [Kitasatospora sp. NBC_01287]